MTRTYSPGDVVVIVNDIILSGFTDTSIITVEPNVQSFSKYVSTDGLVTRVRSSDRTASCTITLKQTSPSNDVLTELLNDDLNAGDQVFPFSLSDNFGATLISSETAWIQGWPSTALGSEVNERSWVIDLAKTNWFVGGNVNITG